MAYEFELKAKLDNHEAVKDLLFRLGEYYQSYKRLDTYWIKDEKTPLIRLRRESGDNAAGTPYQSNTISFKRKEISGCMEVNHEQEFTVSNADCFEDMLVCLGLNIANNNEKHGWAWIIPDCEDRYSPIIAEISLVAGLGWFLELEIITATCSEETAEESRKRLYSLLELLNIPLSHIETRPYTVLLSKLTKGE